MRWKNSTYYGVGRPKRMRQDFDFVRRDSGAAGINEIQNEDVPEPTDLDVRRGDNGIS